MSHAFRPPTSASPSASCTAPTCRPEVSQCTPAGWPAMRAACTERTGSIRVCVAWSRLLHPRRMLTPQTTSATKATTASGHRDAAKHRAPRSRDGRRVQNAGSSSSGVSSFQPNRSRSARCGARPRSRNRPRGAPSEPPIGELRLERECDQKRQPERHRVAPVGRREEPRDEERHQQETRNADSATAHRHQRRDRHLAGRAAAARPRCQAPSRVRDDLSPALSHVTILGS